MTTREELWDKAIHEAQTNWQSGQLESKSDGKHCAMGCLGYARWGRRWDRYNYGYSRWDYKDILDDEHLGPMTKVLAKVMQEHAEMPISTLLFGDGIPATIVCFNDREGQDQVVAMMEKARANDQA